MVNPSEMYVISYNVTYLIHLRPLKCLPLLVLFILGLSSVRPRALCPGSPPEPTGERAEPVKPGGFFRRINRKSRMVLGWIALRGLGEGQTQPKRSKSRTACLDCRWKSFGKLMRPWRNLTSLQIFCENASVADVSPRPFRYM